MIESFSDYISTSVLIALLGLAFYVVFRVFLSFRQERMIEEEIEYYQDW
jgi:hypothetical protein